MKPAANDKRDLLLFGVLLCALLGYSLLVGGQGASSERQMHRLIALGAVDAIVMCGLLTVWAVTGRRRR